jgi:hypothetical protein
LYPNATSSSSRDDVHYVSIYSPSVEGQRNVAVRRLKSAACVIGLALVLLVSAGSAASGPAEATCLTAIEPQVGAAANGDTIVLWRCESLDRLQTAYRSAATGSWSRLDDIPPAAMDDPRVDLRSPALAVNGRGDAAATWGVLSLYKGGIFSLVQAAVRPVGATSWSAAESLSLPNTVAVAPHIAIDASGNAVAVWAARDGSCYSDCRWRMQAAVRPAASGAWGEPQDLAATSPALSTAEVAFDGAGSALVVWAEGPVLRAALRPAGAGGWNPPQLISDEGARGPVESPRLAVDSAGNALVIWGHGSQGGSRPVSVRAALRSAATGAWSAQDLPGTSDLRSVLQLALAMNVSGDAAAVWRRGTDSSAPVVIEASLRDASSGRWTPPQRLSGVRFRDGLPPLDNLPGAPGVALDAHGNAVAVWQEPVHTEYATCPDAPCLSIAVAAVRPAATGIWSAPERWPAAAPQVAAGPADTAVAVWTGYELHTLRCSGDPCLIVQAAVHEREEGTWSAPTYLSAPAPRPCVVPRVVGKALARAKAAVKRRDCSVGRISYRRSTEVRRGRVLAQRPKAGARLRAGSSVRLVVSRGR